MMSDVATAMGFFMLLAPVAYYIIWFRGYGR